MKTVGLVLLACILVLPVPLMAGNLEIYNIDVKQGDATLIVGPDRTTVLVDSGRYSYAYTNILNLLSELSITSLDYTIVTHYDQDHIDAFCDVLDQTGPPTVAAFDRGGDRRASGASSATPAVFTDYVGCVGAARQTITVDTTIDLGDGATITVLAVGDADFISSGTSDFTTLWDGSRLTCANKENEKSVALAISYDGFDMLLMGDLTGVADAPSQCSDDRLNTEGPVAGIYTGPDFGRGVDVYHVDHHGSDLTSNSYSFLQTVAPEVAVISAGDASSCGPGFNSYGHPGQATLDRLYQVGVDKIYQTQEGGADYVSSTPPCQAQIGETYPRNYHGVPHDFLYSDHVRIVTDGLTYSIENAVGGTDVYNVDDTTGDDDDDICSDQFDEEGCPSGIKYWSRVLKARAFLADHPMVRGWVRQVLVDGANAALLPQSIQDFFADVLDH